MEMRFKGVREGTTSEWWALGEEKMEALSVGLVDGA